MTRLPPPAADGNDDNQGEDFAPPHLPLLLTPHAASRMSFEYRVLPCLAAAFGALAAAMTPEGDPAALKAEAYILQYAMGAMALGSGLTAAYTHAAHYLTDLKATELSMTEEGLLIRELHKIRGELSKTLIKPHGWEAAIRTPINNEPFRVCLRPWGHHEREIVLQTPLSYREAEQVTLMLNHAIAYYNAPHCHQADIKTRARSELQELLAQPQPAGLASSLS